MAFVTGLMLIDAPASALNNLGNVQGRQFDNVMGTKIIRTREGAYPYVSAQAFRYWLRESIVRHSPEWKKAPIYREEKIAFTAADPINYWDDDIFGYMRAPDNKPASKKRRQEDPEYKKLTPLDANEKGQEQALTRSSPFRVSTFVSIAPVNIVEDWESASRHEGDSVPYSSQFYRATLKGLFSLNLRSCGTFWYRNKTGFKNLDNIRTDIAESKELINLAEEKAYQLPDEERLKRISALFEGLAHLEGGAKQTLHYTDVSPVIIIMAITKGGNHIFGHAIGANSKGLPEIKLAALRESLRIFNDDLLSDVYVGWVNGYADDERAKLEKMALPDENNEEQNRTSESSNSEPKIGIIVLREN